MFIFYTYKWIIFVDINYNFLCLQLMQLIFVFFHLSTMYYQHTAILHTILLYRQTQVHLTLTCIFWGDFNYFLWANESIQTIYRNVNFSSSCFFDTREKITERNTSMPCFTNFFARSTITAWNKPQYATFVILQSTICNEKNA